VAAILATVDRTFGYPVELGLLVTLRALKLLAIAHSHQVVQAGFIIRELFEEL
jgi:hypothetical protein